MQLEPCIVSISKNIIILIFYQAKFLNCYNLSAYLSEKTGNRRHFHTVLEGNFPFLFCCLRFCSFTLVDIILNVSSSICSAAFQETGRPTSKGERNSSTLDCLISFSLKAKAAMGPYINFNE